jgi:hypothetical protein
VSSSLPPPSVQTPPQGLLGFLGIKNGGQFPSPLMPGVQAQIDLLRFYFEMASEPAGDDLIAVPAGGNTTFSTFLIVPPRKAWIVTNINFVFAIAPATPYRSAFIGAYNRYSKPQKLFGASLNPIPAVGESSVVFSNDWFFMDSGWKIGAGAWGGASAGFNCSGTVCRYEFDR